jgi:type I restriction enzyme, S subunit
VDVKPSHQQSELGVIPNDWEVRHLGELFALKSGFAFSSAHFSDQGPILLTPGNFSLDGGLYFTERNTKHYSGPYSSSMVFDWGDLLVVMTDLTPDCNLLGKPAFVGLHEPILHNQRIGKIVPINNRISLPFLYWFFLSDAFAARMKETATGSTVRHTSNGSIYKSLIALPPNAEQEAIAEALNDADALIDAMEQLLAKKRHLKQGAMQDLLTGKKRLPGFSGDWGVRPLGDLFHFGGGFSASRDQLSTDGHCYLHYGDIHRSAKTYIDVRAEHQNIPKLDIPLKRISPASMLADGDVVFVDASEDDEGTSKHVVIINKDKIPYISGLHTIVAKSKTDDLDHLYRRYCFQTTAIKRQFYFFSVGTKVSGISKTNIAKVTVPVPSLPEQKAISLILADMDAEIAELERKLVKTRSLKRGMMQELLTGSVRLS